MLTHCCLKQASTRRCRTSLGTRRGSCSRSSRLSTPGSTRSVSTKSTGQPPIGRTRPLSRPTRSSSSSPMSGLYSYFFFPLVRCGVGQHHLVCSALLSSIGPLRGGTTSLSLLTPPLFHWSLLSAPLVHCGVGQHHLVCSPLLSSIGPLRGGATSLSLLTPPLLHWSLRGGTTSLSLLSPPLFHWSIAGWDNIT